MVALFMGRYSDEPDGEPSLEGETVTAGIGRVHIGPRDHVVQFYGHDEELIGTVGDYLLSTLATGGAAVVIASHEHRRAFEAWLVSEGVDVVRARARGIYRDLDAQEIVDQFMANGHPDGVTFERVVGGVVRAAVAGSRAVRAYGAMVALLGDSGLVNAAIELEALWNDLGRRYPFSLFCAYPAHSVSGGDGLGALDKVCLLHGEIVGPSPGVETRVFAFTLEAPAAARHFAVDAVRRLGAGHLADDVALIATELAANAVLHARSAFTLVLSAHREVVRILVRDGLAVDAGPLLVTATHGLGVVSALAKNWGVIPLGAEGKAVWAELASGR
jgi:hypothetical protein